MTIEDPDMKPFTGVFKQPGTANWSYQKKVPKDLLGHPAIARAEFGFRASLGTSDLREANKLAVAKLAELNAYWDSLYASQKLTTPEQVPPALVDAISQRLKTAVLAEDDGLRADPVALAESLSHWWGVQERARKLAHERALREAQSEAQEPPPYRPKQVPRWLTDEGREELKDYVQAGQEGVVLADLLDLLQERHRAAAEQARAALGKKNTGPFLVLAEREAMVLGVNLGADAWMSPQAAPLRDACQRAYLEALHGLALRDGGDVVTTPPAPTVLTQAPERPANVSAPAPQGLTLGEVVKAILESYPANDFKRKLNMVTSLMLKLLGPELPVKDLKQAQVSAFLSKVCKLPADWYTQTLKGANIVKLLDQEHPKCIGPTTFVSTYRAAVSAFLERAKTEFHDQGFPLGLSVKFAKYQGTREEYEDQQRNFKSPELGRLFGSREYQEFANAPDMAHRYWLPLLMLYTGARPRELCQINPQVDYGVAENTPFFLLSGNTPADEGVEKTIKTGEERKIPIHPELIRLGFLVYVDRVKKNGARRLFPSFGVNKGDPSARAKSWFSDFLEEVGLRDETPKALLSGLYALKKTFITEAARLGLKFEPITGHTDSSRSKVLRDSYIMEEVPLSDKLAVLEQVVFSVKPPKVSY